MTEHLSRARRAARPRRSRGTTCAAVVGAPDEETFCLPLTGSCTCGPEMAGAERVCSIANEHGVCHGVQTCDPTTGWGACSARTPAPETCNGVDDDCNGLVDDDVGEGDTCENSVPGVGTCYGELQCDGAEGLSCSAALPTPEACDYIDNDCDGEVDEGFLNPITGLYDRDTACGDCSTDCTVLLAAPNARGVCDAATATCVMECDPGAFNLNGSLVDGCELVLDTDAVYVSVDDPTATDDGACGLGPAGTSPSNQPCRTIAQGLSRAQALGRSKVRVADGVYTEPVTLLNGISLLGGHHPGTWERHVASTSTIIEGVSVDGNHERTIVAAGSAGGGAFGIFVVGGGSAPNISHNVILRGSGGRGGAGASGMLVACRVE